MPLTLPRALLNIDPILIIGGSNSDGDDGEVDVDGGDGDRDQ
jgi:hypothetical protein